jgi:hypothetical protein
MRWLARSILAALAATLLAGAPAHAQMRPLAVPATSGWKHAGTGLVLRSRLAGLPRVELSDFGSAELDIVGRFADDSTEISIYLFHPALMDVPIWFDRSEAQILARDIYADPQPIGPPLAFAPPRSTAASGLRRGYRPGKGPFTSTALAMMPMGEWLVGIRISSKTLDSGQTDAKLNEAIAAIGWPEGVADSRPAAPVIACAAPLAFAKRAKMKAPSMNDALFGALLPGIAEDEAAKGEAKPAGPFCRDPASTTAYGVYRQADQRDGYLMALGDNGRTVSISPSLSALIENTASFGVLVGDLDGSTMVYPSFDKLPNPAIVLPAIAKSGPVASTTRGSKDITIGLPAK